MDNMCYFNYILHHKRIIFKTHIVCTIVGNFINNNSDYVFTEWRLHLLSCTICQLP